MIEKVVYVKCRLFNDFTDDEVKMVLSNLHVVLEKYSTDEYIYTQGDAINTIGIIVKGSINILKEDYDGNTNIISTLREGDMFAEVFVLAGVKEIPVTVSAASECEIIHLDYKMLIIATSKLGDIHVRLIDNLLKIVAGNALALNRKLQIVSKKTTRGKVLEYLYSQSRLHKSNEFKINYSREELANYLCVDRSALSRELSNMERDGLIEFDKNNFKIIN